MADHEWGRACWRPASRYRKCGASTERARSSAPWPRRDLAQGAMPIEIDLAVFSQHLRTSDRLIALLKRPVTGAGLAAADTKTRSSRRQLPITGCAHKARVVSDERMAARRVLAACDVAAERHRAAALDCTDHFQLVEAHMPRLVSRQVGPAPRRMSATSRAGRTMTDGAIAPAGFSAGFCRCRGTR